MNEEEFFKHHQDDFKLEKDEKKSPWKKIFVFLAGTFLLLLMVSFVFVTFPIDEIIRGKLESKLLEDNMIKLEEFTIFFEKESYQQLKSIYLEEQKNEFSVCLQGHQDKDYHITYLYQPEIYQQSFNQVSFESCSGDTLIILHSHPYKRCIASEQDLKMLAENKARNVNVLMVVMCEPERFAVYQ